MVDDRDLMWKETLSPSFLFQRRELFRALSLPGCQVALFFPRTMLRLVGPVCCCTWAVLPTSRHSSFDRPTRTGRRSAFMSARQALDVKVISHVRHIGATLADPLAYGAGPVSLVWISSLPQFSSRPTRITK